jgi:hypothetical protein
MKKILILIILLVYFFSVNSQTHRCGIYTHMVNFEDTANIHRYIILDTNNSNIWSIGKPDKLKFDSAYSPKNAIMTNTKESYPPNTNSSFKIQFLSDFLGGSNYCDRLYVEGYFKIDSDTLIDYGIIETRDMIGHPWREVTCYFDGITQKAVFSGNLSDKWHYFSFDVNPEVMDYSHGNDTTFLIRFTFISDSIDTHKAGWILDNLSMNNETPGGINDIVHNNDLFSISPNPVNQNDNFTISIKKIDVESIKIYDSQGNLHNQIIKPRNSVTLNTYQFLKGIYLIEAFDKKGNRQIKKLLIN